ncbi:MAG: hypothetical protein EPN64_13115 [Burkholderiaceae bacterium]|nr:MAG: hypothetical protein EPN64_13115 [Burkholderiaceae bacterium]
MIIDTEDVKVITETFKPAIFKLANGEVVRVSLWQGGLGTEGFRLKITTDRGLLTVMPSSGNSIELSTVRALEQEQQKVREGVANRIHPGQRISNR